MDSYVVLFMDFVHYFGGDEVGRSQTKRGSEKENCDKNSLSWIRTQDVIR